MTEDRSNVRTFPNNIATTQRYGRDITRVISVTSGKGGVGKTTTVVNLAIALSQAGKKVLVLDADLGLANVNILLGLRPEKTIEDVISGQCFIEEIMIDGPAGVSIIPASSGVSKMTQLTDAERMLFMQALESVAYDFDYLLIDTQAGIGHDVLQFNTAASEIICVINDEPTSLTDAYGLIKVMAQDYKEKKFSVLVNNVESSGKAKQAYARLANAVDRFLQVDTKYLGWIKSDGDVPLAVKEQRALLEIYPSSPASRSYVQLSKAIDEEFYQARIKGGMQMFFQQLLEANAHGS